MAKIRPFPALRFTEKAGDIKSLCCPPYDIVSAPEREELIRKNKYNIINLELPVGENRYEKAGETLKEWMKDGILRKDPVPGYYVYREDFEVNGKKYSFQGFMTELESRPFSDGVVLPHEETLSKAKEDRFNLMKTCFCNFSQIYALFTDEGNTVENILRTVTSAQPLQCFTDDNGVTHSMWPIYDDITKNKLTRFFEDKKLYIADGHHRYETSVNFKNYLYENGIISTPDDGGNFVLTMLVPMESDGLVVFPTHRIVRGLDSFNKEDLIEKSKKYFSVEKIEKGDVERKLSELYSSGEKAFVMYCGDYHLFTLKDSRFTKEIYPDKSDAYCGLDVTVLHSLVLEKVLGIDKENMANQKNLIYTRDISEAVKSVDKGEADCSFILNPTKVEEIKNVATAGEKMPQKSTYFYPKLITGMVMNKFLGE